MLRDDDLLAVEKSCSGDSPELYGHRKRPSWMSMHRDKRGSRPRIISRRDFLASSMTLAGLMVLGSGIVGRAAGLPPTKVGFIAPGTGPLAHEVNSLIAGFELYLKEKGESAAPLEILREDPGPDEEKTLEVAATLVMSQGVRFLIGPFSLKGSEQAVHGLGGGKVIQFLPNPSVRLVAGELCLPECFRLRPNTFQSVHLLAAWALKNVGVKVFLTGDDDYLGNEHADFFAAGFERAGGSFTDRIMFSNDPAAISGVIEAARKTKADFIFAAARDEQAAAFLKAVRSAAPALTQPVIGPESLTAYPRTLGLMGEQAAKVRTLTALADAPALIERLKKAGAKDVVYAERAAEGYDIAAVICASLAKAGQGKADIPELVQIVSGVEIDGARGKVSFDKNHEPIVNMVVQEWEFKAGTAQPKTLESLGVSQSLDFGCGRVGFPKKPAPEGEETPRSDWLDE